MTKHYKQMLLPSRNVAEGQLMFANGKWYLYRGDEIAQIPIYLYKSLIGEKKVTQVFGPYIFWNDFDKTPEAEYLKQLFRYRKLTPVAQRKVEQILSLNSVWVCIYDDFKKALEERENGIKG